MAKNTNSVIAEAATRGDALAHKRFLESLSGRPVPEERATLIRDFLRRNDPGPVEVQELRSCYEAATVARA